MKFDIVKYGFKIVNFKVVLLFIMVLLSIVILCISVCRWIVLFNLFRLVVCLFIVWNNMVDKDGLVKSLKFWCWCISFVICNVWVSRWLYMVFSCLGFMFCMVINIFRVLKCLVVEIDLLIRFGSVLCLWFR